MWPLLWRGMTSIRGVCVQACETSTGAAHDVRALGESSRRIRRHSWCGVRLGADDVRMDEWGLDAVVAGSQKAMMLPPGLAFVAMSDRAWQRGRNNLPRYYFDLPNSQRTEQDDHPYTLPTSLVVALREALGPSVRKDSTTSFSAIDSSPRPHGLGSRPWGYRSWRRNPQ